MDHLLYSGDRKNLVLAFVGYQERPMRVSDNVKTVIGRFWVIKLKLLVKATTYGPFQPGEGLLVL